MKSRLELANIGRAARINMTNNSNKDNGRILKKETEAQRFAGLSRLVSQKRMSSDCRTGPPSSCENAKPRWLALGPVLVRSAELLMRVVLTNLRRETASSASKIEVKTTASRSLLGSFNGSLGVSVLPYSRFVLLNFLKRRFPHGSLDTERKSEKPIEWFRDRTRQKKS